jgi:hypothetical protein
VSEAQHKPLSSEQIQNILSQKKPRGLTTEPREIGVWYKQNHLLRERGCDNPDCKDPRDANDRGRRIVIQINDKYLCRYCFLEGWLSPNADED